ncbi:DUF916 domain-containing protein, partial [Candidatus Saccharibacteria bacterium]|nr:DUF916 domain-containing protein [Candidatus Saccharibacteria bacterium]
MKRFQSILGAIVVVCASIMVALSGTVSGASLDKGNGMQVAPVRTDLILKPGESKTITVLVKNVTGGKELLRVVTNDFTANDESGAPGLLLNGESDPNHGLKEYMTVPETVTVPKGEQKEVRVTIKMPENVAGGGYYGAVRFIPIIDANNTNTQGDSVSLAGSVASLV